MAKTSPITVTIARQLGAGGADLGQRLAARLQFAYLDREILKLTAERLGVNEHSIERWDERVSNFWERLVDSLSVGPPEGVFTTVPTPLTVRDQRLFEMEARVIRELAQRRSCVVIGRAAFWTLRGMPGLLKIFVHAPRECRTPMVMQAFKLATMAEAKSLVERVDRDREKFVQAMTGRSLTDSRNFDVAIDTHAVPMEAAVDMVARLVEHAQSQGINADCPEGAPQAAAPDKN